MMEDIYRQPKWYIWSSLDGWELSVMGPCTFYEACTVAKLLYQTLNREYGQILITTKKDLHEYEDE